MPKPKKTPKPPEPKKMPKPPEPKKVSKKFKIPKVKQKLIGNPTQNKVQLKVTPPEAVAASIRQRDATLLVQPPVQPMAAPSATATMASCGTKRKYDAIEEVVQPNSSVNDRLKRIRQECQEKLEKEKGVGGERQQSTGAKLDDNTNLGNPMNMSEEQLSVMRAKLIFELNSADKKEPSCDDDVSMATGSSSSSSDMGVEGK